MLDKGHKVRNLTEYEGHLGVDERLVGSMIEAADAPREAVVAKGPIPKTTQQEL